jgi:hypothetical protein
LNQSEATPSCSQPTPEIAAYCAALEQAILATTVRLELTRWQDVDGRAGEYITGGNSHATVMDGRYLVTHNHFGEMLTAMQNQGIPGEQIRLTLYKTNGEVILADVPITILTVVAQDSQTLVLDFNAYGTEGLFAALGLPSAQFAAGQTLPLQPGLEVAQIDWNGQTSHVRWTQIESVAEVNGTPQLKLATPVAQGASGGGVFWNGYHIANNWSRGSIQGIDSGVVTDQYSVAALNSLGVTAVTALAQPNAHQTSQNTESGNIEQNSLGETEQASY